MFYWKAVDNFNIVADQAALTGKTFWFDNIQLVNQDTALIYQTSAFSDLSYPVAAGSSVKIIPNPVSFNTTISYTLDCDDRVEVGIYNLLGQKLKTLFSSQQIDGTHSLLWNADTDKWCKILPGVYFCRVKSSVHEDIGKIIIM